MKSPVTIAFVSGKGGVGKTTIATNLAWLIASSGARIVLVDIDFQNLGCTGLFESRYQLGASDVLAELRAENSGVAAESTEVAKNLRFLPASFRLPNSDSFLDNVDDLRERLRRLIAAMAARDNLDCVILDCHGAVDAPSIAAAGLADHTIVVTEADTVTFAGTLELIESYYSAYQDSARAPSVSFVVNRIPPKYSWRDLDQLYRKHLQGTLGRLGARTHVFYIPAEGYMADSFGEYPFQVELAPSSLFAKKLGLIAYELFHENSPHLVPERFLRSYESEWRRKRIERRVLSSETRNVRGIIASYALASLAFVSGIAAGVSIGIFGKGGESGNGSAYGTIILVVGSIVTFCILIAMTRVISYYRERHGFQSRLLRVLPPAQARWHRLAVWKLRALLTGAIAAPAMVALFVGLLVYSIVFG